MNKILLIGCGHMGGALLDSWLKTKKYNLTVVDPKKYNLLKKKYKNEKIILIKSISDLEKRLKFKFVILAMKPLDFTTALDELYKYELNKNATIISVVAGKKIKTIQSKLTNNKNIFRVMPNMPASISKSMNCIVKGKLVSKSKINEVNQLFSHSGKTIFLNNEDEIDMATAISGSGPGFVFYMIHAFEKAAIKLGFKKKSAKTLVLQTFKGSIDLILENNIPAYELVKTVATKGGTTEAGLKVMNEKKINKAFIDLTRAAYKKAKQQGK